MEYSPRQLTAFLFMASKRRQRELREQFHVAALAARGEPEAVRALMRQLADG
jgi:hypothetical protein